MVITLDELEIIRKKTKRLLIINIIVFLLGASLHLFGIIIIILSLGFYFIKVKNQVDQYKELYKNNIVRVCLEGEFTELNYEAGTGISIDEVKESGLVDLNDEFHSNDLIVAKYGKVKFKQSDIAVHELIKRGPDDCNADKKECFIGRFLVFDFMKTTDALVKVLGKNYKPRGENQGVIEKVINTVAGLNKENQVFLESESFNHNFKTFSSDAQTAFYILTPQMIDAITMLSDKYEGKIAISFKNEKMFVAISSKKDALEAKVLSNRTIWQEKELVLKDIKVITDFIELMKLENNTHVATAN